MPFRAVVVLQLHCEESLMCPACLTTLVLIVTGSTSVGSFTGFAMNKFHRCDQESLKEGDIHEETQDRNT